MTTRTSRRIVCGCGHAGSIDLSENDQPYGGLWEQYELDGFDGKSLTITSFADAPADLLAYLKPKCPSCGQTGKVRYA